MQGATILICRPEGFRAFQVWRRLFETSLPEVPLRMAICADARTADIILAGLPPSQAVGVERSGPRPEAFGGQPVAVVVTTCEGEAVTFAGGPRDEAWDQIEEILKAS